MTNTYTHILDAIANVADGHEPSMKAIANLLDVPTTRLYAKARTPKPGEVYDPQAINWDKISEYVASFLDVDTTPWDNMEDFVLEAARVDEEIAANPGRRTSVSKQTVDVDGEQMPIRKTAMFELGNENESLVCFKKDANVYKIVYQTAGYTVLRVIDKEMNLHETLKVVSNLTLNTKCVPPCTMKEAIEKRFSGEYQVENKEVAE